MLLQWIKLNQNISNIVDAERTRILATMTALHWFGKDNKKFVRKVWKNLSEIDFWNYKYIAKPFYQDNDFIVHPFISPESLRSYLLEEVVNKMTDWNDLYPEKETSIAKQFNVAINSDNMSEDGREDAIRMAKEMWNNFMNTIFTNKSMILFAQRKYINESFSDFNQMETLDDTNVPWDWDHIYPDSWIHYQQNISALTKKWNSSIGNFRAMSLEENRSENANHPPKARLADVMVQSFIKKNDWEYWSQIGGRILKNDEGMIKIHLKAVILRLCNIYEEWYDTLKIGNLFRAEDKS